ncbi:replication initiator protein A [Leuconostoc lactis]|uniref:replication initiator protein A n=1 Tax=Leuconostoc lactis TaxID=1246 RepID=UPI002174DB16|nr:replication initiator protein A [Leuconostoc lactis]
MMQRISRKQIDTSERFYMIPKALFENDVYATLRPETKLAYGILKDRFKLSLKNNWVDDAGNVFLIYKNSDLQQMLGVGEKKVIAIKKELAKYDLLEEERQGLNRPNRLYIGNIDIEKTLIDSPNSFEDKELSNRQVRNRQNDRSRTAKLTGQELSERQSNDTEYRDTKLSETKRDNSFDDEDDSVLDAEAKLLADETPEQDEIKCGELIGSNIQIRDLVLKYFGNMLVEDPKTMVSVLEALIHEYNTLGIKLDEGNSDLLNLANKLGRDGALLFVLNKVVKQQLLYMRENLAVYTHFADYFAKGLANRIKLVTAVQPNTIGF